jgi:bacterioferritin-associated ferredoxin
MHIDRCYCYQELFADLKRIAEETGADSVEDLQAHVTFGHNCQLCHPYVRRMLRTGDVAFDRVVTEADEPPAEPVR